MADTIDEGFDAVRLALEKTYDSFTSRFNRCEPLRSMLTVAGCRMASFSEETPACGIAGGPLGYWGSRSPPELEMWYFSLMFVEYMAGLWLIKADNKQGSNDCHNVTHAKPCPHSRDFHMELLRKYRDQLQTLCAQITARLPAPPSGTSAAS